MARKNDTCEICSPDAKLAVWKTETHCTDDLQFVPVWRCNNCGTRKHRRVVKTVARNERGLTASQERTVARLIGGELCLSKHDVVASHTVTATDYGVCWLAVETAHDGYWHICIGPRGRAVAHAAPNWFKDGEPCTWINVHRAPKRA